MEKKSTAKLQEARTVRKIVKVDDHICLAFAGLTADARVLVNRARTEAQSYRLTLDEKADIEYMTRYIAGIQQKYTQSGGVRPFGISTLLVGFDPLGNPCLYQTDPSGTYTAWKANAIGRNSKTVSWGHLCSHHKISLCACVQDQKRTYFWLTCLCEYRFFQILAQTREFLEKNYEETSGDATLKLALRALLETVEASSKTVELAVMEPSGLRILEDAKVDALVAEIEAEKAAAEAAKKTTQQQQAAAAAAASS